MNLEDCKARFTLATAVVRLQIFAVVRLKSARITLATIFVRLYVLKMAVEELAAAAAAVALIFKYHKKIKKRKRECWVI